MKIIVAPQALKGSLDAPAVAAIIAGVLADALPDADVTVIPVADGGEGTTHALISATGGRLLDATVTGPLGAPVHAQWGALGGEDATPTAVIEMAAAAGLTLLASDQRDPLHATTRGFGELIRRALDAGCRDFILGLGGSATNDG
ncbi:MAG: glycerate kinase, partial [Chloroflexota bacterium]|nr:glycerate kinase [Chloroflexota bacterium]